MTITPQYHQSLWTIFLTCFIVLGMNMDVAYSFYPQLVVKTTTITRKTPMKNSIHFSSTTSNEDTVTTYFDDLVDAVKASTTFGLYGPDKLHELADKVDAGASSCIFEVEGNTLCEKEIQDRKDVAEVLRMQAELQLRMQAIEGSSLFVDDCLAEDAIRQRDDLMELLGEDAL